MPGIARAALLMISLCPAAFAAAPVPQDGTGRYLLSAALDSTPPRLLLRAGAADAGAPPASSALQRIMTRPCYWEGAGTGAMICDHDALRARQRWQAVHDAIARQMFAGQPGGD